MYPHPVFNANLKHDDTPLKYLQTNLLLFSMMAAPAVLVDGILDKPGFWTQVLRKSDPYVKLCLRHCSARPWTQTDNVVNYGKAMEVAWLLATRIVAKHRITSPASTTVWTMMETLAPKVHNTRYLAQQQADEQIIEAVYVSRSLGEIMTNYTAQQYQDDLAALAIDQDFEVPQNNEGLPATVDDALDQVQNKAATAAMAILWIQARRAANLSTRPSQVLVTTLCALAKQGMATPGFVDKITNGFMQDTGKQIELDTEAISACWDLIVHHVDDGNVENVVRKWLARLPHEALRLRITLQQIPGEGLTCITSIIKAVGDYPMFNWAWVTLNFPIEARAVATAVTEINGKPYYGYKKDLSIVKAANYRTVGYIAQQLLVKVGGEGPLKAARCFTRTPKLKVVIDEMINDFMLNSITLEPAPGAMAGDWFLGPIHGFVQFAAPLPAQQQQPNPQGGAGANPAPPPNPPQAGPGAGRGRGQPGGAPQAAPGPAGRGAAAGRGQQAGQP
ncbi:hypothetical protein 1 [Wenling crustacean virus 14]|uniref:Uncharacterized protein n=1 Tax=Wenling crustacean virus 14 TaxID=1923483 RepID=A0A1L3KN86_9VIRU|nr:hypothetical protein 1 [Wenling crustacean virus 14]APG78826.1 hypothetical protein 1 [Wenling crustacean virus 14]